MKRQLKDGQEPNFKKQRMDWLFPMRKKISLFDIKETDLPERLKNSVQYSFNGICHQIKDTLPDIKRAISPNVLDLQSPSDDFWFLASVCYTGNIKLIKYFIEVEGINPHYIKNGVNVMFCVTPSVSSDQNSAESIQYLASLGINMELVYTPPRSYPSTELRFTQFIGDDDCANPQYINTKKVLSLGFNLCDSVKNINKSEEYDIRKMIQYGFGGDIDVEFGNIELLKPRKVVNVNVLKTVPELLEKILFQICAINTSRNCDIGWVTQIMMNYFTVRDVSNIYQYIVTKNNWNNLPHCKWLR